MDLTIAICAYNARDRIAMVLESLDRQEASDVRWELLLINNASTDGTADAARAMSQSFRIPVRIIDEPKAGLSYARCTAAVEAKAPVISFLDDDVVVPPDWVTACITFMREKPQTGIVGARVMPLFEDPLNVPADFQDRFARLLSMYDQGDGPMRALPGKMPMPVGAGMTGRRDIFRFVYGELGSIAVGRKGSSLAGGEDLEAMYVAREIGWEIWYNPKMRLEHFVPRRKLNDQYRDKWMIDTARCHAWLHILSGAEQVQSSRACARRAIGLELLVIKYALMGLLPGSLHENVAKAGFWRQFYHAKASGWWQLAGSFQRAQRIRQKISQSVMPKSALKSDVTAMLCRPEQEPSRK